MKIEKLQVEGVHSVWNLMALYIFSASSTEGQWFEVVIQCDLNLTLLNLKGLLKKEDSICRGLASSS